MKEDKWVRLWKIIGPPVYYFFIQMVIEMVFVISAVFLEITGIYKENGMINNSLAVMNSIQDAVNNNVSYITALSALAAIIIFGYMFNKDIDKGISTRGKKTPGTDIFAASYFAVMLSLALSSLILSANIDNIAGSYEEVAGSLLTGNVVYRLAVSGVIVPAAEEIIYRGLVYGRALREFGRVGAVLISSAAFGIFHFNLVQGIYAFLIGIALAYFYGEYGNLKVSIYMHMAINIVAVLLEYYGIYAIIEKNAVIKLLAMLFEAGMAAYTFNLICKNNDKKRGS